MNLALPKGLVKFREECSYCRQPHVLSFLHCPTLGAHLGQTEKEVLTLGSTLKYKMDSEGTSAKSGSSKNDVLRRFLVDLKETHPFCDMSSGQISCPQCPSQIRNRPTPPYPRLTCLNMCPMWVFNRGAERISNQNTYPFGLPFGEMYPNRWLLLIAQLPIAYGDQNTKAWEGAP